MSVDFQMLHLRSKSFAINPLDLIAGVIFKIFILFSCPSQVILLSLLLFIFAITFARFLIYIVNLHDNFPSNPNFFGYVSSLF